MCFGGRNMIKCRYRTYPAQLCRLVLSEALRLECIRCKRVLTQIVILLRFVVVQVAHALLTHHGTHTMAQTMMTLSVDSIRLRDANRGLRRVRVLGQWARAGAAIVSCGSCRFALTAATERRLRQVLCEGCLRSKSQLVGVVIAGRTGRVVRCILVVHPASYSRYNIAFHVRLPCYENHGESKS